MSQIAAQTERRVGRRQINHEQMPARFREGTLKAIDAALAEGEKRADFIREAVDDLLSKRLVGKHKAPVEPRLADIAEEDEEAFRSPMR